MHLAKTPLRETATEAIFHLKYSHLGHLPMSTTRWKTTLLNSGDTMTLRNSEYFGSDRRTRDRIDDKDCIDGND